MAAIAAPFISSVLPFLLNKLFPGEKSQIEQQPAMAGGQMGLLSQLTSGMGGALGSGLGGLQKLLSGDTEAFEKPLMSQFYQSTIPKLAEKFSGMGSGAQGSSAFQRALGQEGAGLSERLGAMRGGLQMHGLGQLSNLLQSGLGAKPFESLYRPGTEGLGSAMAPGIGEKLPGQIEKGTRALFDLFKKQPGATQTPGPYGSYTPGTYDMYKDITTR